MLFASPLFLFIFFPLFAVSYALTPAPMRNGLILLGSLIFYGWAEPRFLLILVGSSIVDWLLANRVAAGGKDKRFWLVVGICMNVGLLAYFKYANFFFESIVAVFPGLAATQQGWGLKNILLPLAISFVTFEKITYLVDIARGISVPTTFRNYLLFVCFFPKLLAGPIVKFHEIEPQLGDRSITYDNLATGFQRFLVGLAKKVLIADTLARIVDPLFPHIWAIGTLNCWLILIGFIMQLFWDFSAYCDMAIGLARMMGFRLRENFDMPYASIGIYEFWTRWHISLGTWIREYLYTPLQGKHAGTLRTALNLWICFLLSGLWHGANWTFVIFGAVHGAAISLNKLTHKHIELPTPVARALFLAFFIPSMVLFRSPTYEHATKFLKCMFNWAPQREFVVIGADFYCALIFACVFSMVRSETVIQGLHRHVFARVFQPRYLTVPVLGLLFVVSLSKVVASTFHPFIYFRF